jgi:hypothetical protein
MKIRTIKPGYCRKYNHPLPEVFTEVEDLRKDYFDTHDPRSQEELIIELKKDPCIEIQSSKPNKEPQNGQNNDPDNGNNTESQYKEMTVKELQTIMAEKGIPQTRGETKVAMIAKIKGL